MTQARPSANGSLVMAAAVAVLLARGLPVADVGDTSGRKPEGLRVLFLGASYFSSAGGSYQPFEGFCESDGVECEAVAPGELPEYAHGVEFAGLDAPVRTPAEAAASPDVHSLIENGGFDFVILWAGLAGLPEGLMPEGYRGGQLQSPPYDETLAQLTALHRTIVRSGARTVLYMWHGWRPFLDVVHQVAQLHWRLQADLSDVRVDGQRHEVLMVPVGLLWLDALVLPAGYDWQEPFAVRPPRFDPAEWYRDPGHPAALGQYANGCLLYTFLTGRDPRDNAFSELPRSWTVSEETPAGIVSADDAAWIKERAWFYYTASRENDEAQ